MFLKPNHEIVGVVREVICNEDGIGIVFTYEKQIDLPASAIPKEKLKELTGQRIGILNVENKYYFRKI